MFVPDDPAVRPADSPLRALSSALSFTLFDISPLPAILTKKHRGCRGVGAALQTSRERRSPDRPEFPPPPLPPFFSQRLQTPTTYLPWNHIVPKTPEGRALPQCSFPIRESPSIPAQLFPPTLAARYTPDSLARGCICARLPAACRTCPRRQNVPHFLVTRSPRQARLRVGNNWTEGQLTASAAQPETGV